MAKNRTAPRHKRRLRVGIGASAAFTADLGAGGFSTEVMRVLSPGTPVRGSLQLDGVEVAYEGEVAWAQPGDSSIGLRGRMGIRFCSVPPQVSNLFGAGSDRSRG